MLGCAADIGMIALAFLAGSKGFSLWWAMIVAFVAGSLALSNGPAYDFVVRANEEGRLKVFPSLLAANVLPRMILCGVVFYVTRYLVGGG